MAALAPGTQIDRYVIDHLVGVGGMGEVYAATHAFLSVRVALKVLNRAYRGRSALVEKMRAEAQLLRRLEHPHLVRVSDAGMTGDGTVWMVMDLLEGDTLRALLNRQPRMPPERALKYAAQAASGVAAAHEHGVIHRDLKPENVFVTRTDDVKILDFGTAKFRDLTPTTVGSEHFTTLLYAAPEQVACEALDGRADVYALGVVLHEALSGRHYLRKPDGNFPNVVELAMQHLTRQPSFEGLHPEVASVLARATAKRAADRYPTMRAFAEALAALQARRSAPAVAATAEATFSPVSHATDPAVRPRGVRVSTTMGLAFVAAALAAMLTVATKRRAAAAGLEAAPPAAGASVVAEAASGRSEPPFVAPPPARARDTPAASSAPAASETAPSAGPSASAPAGAAATPASRPSTTTGQKKPGFMHF